MKIGVFDSGVGGLSVANAIQVALPEHQVIFREDRSHIPYGSRDPAEILSFVTPIFSELVELGCQVIVIACNTVTTTLIDKLREQLSVPLIGIEPMVKPAAALTKTGVIAVCATPTTLASQRYNWLKRKYASNIKVLEPDCSDWVLLIESQRLNRSKIDTRISQVLDNKADVVVLACTHYHWIEAEIIDLARERATVLQPEQYIIQQLKRVLAQLT